MVMQPAVAEFLPLCERAGLELLVYCTRRDLQEQARLFRKGRPLDAIQRRAEELDKVHQRPDLAAILMTAPPQYERRIVTHAAPGQSLHNYGLAMDCVPMVAGKPAWNDDAPAWQHYGEMAQLAGLTWAGAWLRFKEYPHVQMPDMHWRELITQATAAPHV